MIMKKSLVTFRLKLLLSAGVLASTMLLTACTDDDDVQEITSMGVVKAEFTISFPKQIGGATRMGLDVVQGQANPVFRGISSMQLIPFNKVSTAITTDIALPNAITLRGAGAGVEAGKTGASASADNIIASSGALFTKSNSHLYKDLEIPIGTRSFMFYGVATDKAAPEGVSANAVNGSLTKSTGATTVGDISFSPTPIFVNASTQATDLAYYLTQIANATDGTQTTLTYFPNFTAIKAGSWNSVKAAVKQVYSSIYNNSDALSTAIKTAITKSYTIDSRNVTFATDDGSGNLTFSADYSYPTDIGLPDGAAYVLWSESTKQFDVLGNDNMGLNVTSLDKYAYPASLYYRGLSNIKTSKESKADSYDDTNTWADILSAYTDDNGVVQSTTRSIAIIDKVEYAVGRLDVTVTTKNGAATLPDFENNAITIGTNFPITGIVVANQKAVDYKFETKGDATAYTVFDSQMSTGAEGDESVGYLYAGTTSPSTTHTLVLQTVDASSESDDAANVPIAVEFMNNSSQTIVGKDKQVIYPGTKFYLVGTLKPYNNSTNYYTGTTTPIIKAFVQDYITTANFQVSSLQNAYNVLPDLRIPHLEVGLSVDLSWKDGINQTIPID